MSSLIQAHLTGISSLSKDLKRAFLVGIRKRDRFKASDYQSSPKYFLGGQANKMKSHQFWGIETVAESFEQMLSSPKLQIGQRFLDDQSFFEFLPESLFKEEPIEVQDRRITNSLKAALKQHYLDSTSRFHNRPRRVKQKGFNRYGVGTGQILKDIESDRQD